MNIHFCLRGSMLNMALLGLVPYVPATAAETPQVFIGNGQLGYIDAIDDAADQRVLDLYEAMPDKPTVPSIRSPSGDVNSGMSLAVPVAQLSTPNRGTVEKDSLEHQLKLVVEDDESISIDGHRLVDRAALVDALRSAVERDPLVILTIASARSDNYRGVGTVIYASQRAGVPPENLRLPLNEGEVSAENE